MIENNAIVNAPLDGADLPPRTRAVLNEIRKQENRKLSVYAKLAIFIFTLYLFYRFNIISSNTGSLISVLIVLFVHEMGHFLTMKYFGYRDLKIFFIPMFGAAVSGKETNPGAVKRAVVSLMGPLPGIVIGLITLVLYGKTGIPFLKEYAVISFVINGFNLLPFYPFDGGQFFTHILFSRNIGFEILFKIFGIFGILYLIFNLQMWILLVLVYFIIVSIPASKTIAKLTEILRKDGIKPSDEVKIPDDFIIEMVPRFEKELKSKSINSKKMAAYISNVRIKLKIEKPSIGVSVGFTLLYIFICIFSLVSFSVISINLNFDESKLAWEEFLSDEGRFFVLMPGKPAQSVKHDGKVNNNILFVGLPGAAFTVVYSDVPEKVTKNETTGAILKNYMTTINSKLKGEIISSSPLLSGNNTGLEFIIDLKNKQACKGRVYFINNRIYFINVITQMQNINLKSVQRFFDSFILL